MSRGTAARHLRAALRARGESLAVPSSVSADEDRARLASIVESSYDAIVSKDLRGTIRSWNPAAERLFGFSEREILGRSMSRLIPQERLAEERAIIRRIRQGLRVEPYETVRLHKNGRPVQVSITVSPIRDAAGRVIGASTILRDITQRKEAEATLRESEQRLRAILDSAVDSIITIDQRGTMESVNPATEHLFGYAASELIGRNVKMLMPEPYQSEHDQYLRNYLKTGRKKIIGLGREVSGLRKDGSSFPMSLSVSELKMGQRRLFTGIVHDLSGRRELEREIVEASTDEQRRIGQDLHDGLCQDLIGIAFQADFTARQAAPLSEPLAQAVEKLAATVREAAGQARRLSHGLNPVNLKGGGLPVALEALAAKVTDSFKVACIFRGSDAAELDDDTTANHVYRIAQEAVSNAIRHGKAHRVEIKVASSGGRTVLSVTDDGRGLPEHLTNAASTAPPTGGHAAPASGIGLHTMHYRANLIGGTFQIRPGRDRGAVVTCSIRNEAALSGGRHRLGGEKPSTASGKISSSIRGGSR